MITLRRLNPTGLLAFGTYLEQAKADGTLPPPRELLTDARYSESVVPEVEVPETLPRTKAEVAAILRDLLAPLASKGLETDPGLWSWLALHWLDVLCPPNASGRRKVNDRAHYLLNHTDHRRRYRHLLLMPYRVLKDAPDFNRLWLNEDVSTHGELMEQTASRLYLLRVPAIREAMDRLYFDVVKGQIRRGFLSKNPRGGDIRNRLPSRIKQLRRTFDVEALGADGLIQLMGEEFSRLLPKAA